MDSWKDAEQMSAQQDMKHVAASAYLGESGSLIIKMANPYVLNKNIAGVDTVSHA